MSTSKNAGRNWCFTLNNYTEAEEKLLQTYECEYIIYGREKGEEGTPHLQGYIEFKSPKRLTTIKKVFPRIHLETRRGTARQAAEYCKKDGDFFEQGEISKQGNRTDLQTAAAMVMEKKPIAEIAQEIPETFIKYHRGIEKLREVVLTDRSEKPTVVWLWGKTGVGKTRFPHDHHDTVYIKDGTQWWNGYEQQEAIVIDDFDGKWPYRDLLRLLDRYAYQGQTKGGYVKINSPFIYITCSHPMEYHWKGEELEQMKRRVEFEFEF